MDSFLQDLRFASRMLLKSPLVTGAALLSLALGIGANTTIFTLVNAFFLRGPAAVEEPATLVNVFTTEPGQRFGAFMPTSRLNYEDLRDRTEVFSELVDMLFVGAALTTPGSEPEQVGGQMVTDNYFETLGVRAARGRVFNPEDTEAGGGPGSRPVVVLNHDFWQQRFGGDEDLLGEPIFLNGEAFTVIGIAPPGFTGLNTLANPNFWVPTEMHRTFLNEVFLGWYHDRRAGFTNVFGRLAEGVSAEEADAALATVGEALEQEYPDDNKNRRFTALPLALSNVNPNARENFVRAGALLMGVVGLVLLIACANVANLLLGRAAARRREIGVRLALGAPRGRLVRQLLTESLLLALAAGGLGLLFAVWGRSALWSMRPPFLQQAALDLSFDVRVLVFTLAAVLATGLLFGLAPAIRASRPEIVDDVRQMSDTVEGATRLWSLRNVVVMGQVALSVVALVCAGLLLRSLEQATQIDLGFEPESLAQMNFNLPTQEYDAARGEAFFDRLLERARAVPGIEEASLATVLPLSGGGMWRTVIVEGRDEEAENNRILVPVNTVEPGYLETVGISLSSGRDFSDFDRADNQPVVLINQAMAELFWPGEEPLGKRFNFFGQEQLREVVGIVADTKYLAVGEAPQPQAYMPRRQNYQQGMTLVARAAGDPEAALGPLRQELQDLDRNLPITNAQTALDAVEQSLWNARMGARLLGVLGLIALILASIGIYGVMAYSVNQRSREIGVRMAMGAGQGDVVRLILSQGMAIAGLGLGLGTALALLATRYLEEMLYGTSPTDAVTYAAALLVLALVAALANLLPAWRATHVDPVRVLRFER